MSRTSEVAMKEVENIRRLSQAKVLLSPIRIQLLGMLQEPRTCGELAKALSLSQQRINAHLKELLREKLIVIARRRKVRNLIEATYQAIAKTYWMSPALLRDPEITAAKLQERLSLNNLLVLSEIVQ